MIKKSLLLSVVLAASGCASVMNDASHPMKIETKMPSGEIVNGAECKLSNDLASITAKSGETVNVRRSNKDLDISARTPATPMRSPRPSRV